MSNPGDHGPWNSQGNDDAHDVQGSSAQPSQDPWAQPPAGQPPVLHREDLESEYVHLAQRGYK